MVYRVVKDRDTQLISLQRMCDGSGRPYISTPISWTGNRYHLFVSRHSHRHVGYPIACVIQVPTDFTQYD